MPTQDQWGPYLDSFYSNPKSRMEGFRADVPGGFVEDQYDAEVARAERNKTDEERMAALQATRMQGQFEFNQLVKRGVRPEQALLQTLPQIFAGEPEKMAKTASSLQEFSAPQTSLIPSTPQIVDLGGGLQARRTGPKTWDYATQKDESKKIQDDIKKMELNSAIRQLNSAESALLDPTKKPFVEEALPALRSKVAALQEQMIVGAAPKTNAVPEMPAEIKRSTVTQELPGGGFEIKRKEVKAAPPAAEAKPSKPEKKLTESDARTILKEVGGDKEKARKLARERGYVF